MTDGIKLSGANNKAGSDILESLQLLHQLICDADQTAIAVVLPAADQRLDEGPKSFRRQ